MKPSRLASLAVFVRKRIPRRSARAAESARLEIVCGATHRGFKSHLLRVCPDQLDPDVALDDDVSMRLALDAAREAGDRGDVPVGAVAVLAGRVLATAGNAREALQDPTAHAEMLVLRAASAGLGSWRLEGVTIVVTLEPCAMCAGALVNARVTRLVFGAADLKAGAAGSRYNLLADPRLNHEVEVRGGVLAQECGELLASFFADRR